MAQAAPDQSSQVITTPQSQPSTASSSPTTAVIDARVPGSFLQVAALTLLERLIVSAHRAGAKRIIVCSPGSLPRFRRIHSLGIRFEQLPEPPLLSVPYLFIPGNVFVQAKDLAACAIDGGQLHDFSDTPLGVQVQNAKSHIRTNTAQVCGIAQNHAQASVIERAYWKSLSSSSDGCVDTAFNRPVGRLLSKVLIHTPVSPNMVSAVSILIGLISAFFFAIGDYRTGLIGALLLQFSAIVDCVDGDIARAVFKESPLGKWLDLAGDQLVHVSVFAGIALGAVNHYGSTHYWLLGVAAVMGALISFAVVVRGMSQQRQDSGLQKLIDATTNRDFSVLLLLLAWFEHLELFLWLAAIGSHVFWIIALSLQLRSAPATLKP